MLLKLMKLKNSKGFSLIELIIVIVIIGILAAVVIPNMLDTTGKAHEATVDSMEGTLRSAIEMAHSASLLEGENWYPHPSPAAALHDGTNSQLLIAYLLKSYDSGAWDQEACAYNFATAFQVGGEVAGAPTVDAVKWTYKVGTENEARIYYTATNSLKAVQTWGDKKLNTQMYFAREGSAQTAVEGGGGGFSDSGEQ